MKLVFLGTSSMVPTKDRNVLSTYLRHEDSHILIDCGEGTQRQLKKVNISPTKINTLLISHWHGDHVLGIPGLLMTLASSEYKKTLKIFGPKGTKRRIDNFLKIYIPSTKNIKVEVKELTRSSRFFETQKLEFFSKVLYHSSPCIGFKIKEKDKIKINLTYLKKFNLKQHPLIGKLQKGKNIIYKGEKILSSKATKIVPGKSISIITDTSYNKSISSFVKDSTILISEATFSSDLKKEAKLYKHLTAEQAGKIAKEGKVKKLYLTHFSQRYKDLSIILKESKKQFKNSFLASDLKEVTL